MKNIAFIVPSLSMGGGAENVVSQLSFILQNTGRYKIHILTFYDTKNERPYAGNRESLREDLREPKLKKLFSRARRIRAFCTAHDIETAVAFMEEANFPLLLSKTFGNKAKVVVSERNNPLMKMFAYRIGIRLLYSRADRVVACTKKIQEILERSFRLKNVCAIYNPFDCEQSKILQDKELPGEYRHIFQQGYFVFINVAKLGYAKNQKRIIRALKRIISKHPHAKLAILGEGDIRQELEALISIMELQDNVFLLGKQDNVFPFLKASQCFVLPSLWEGFPNVISEALSVDIPVIAADCETGPREILVPELSVNSAIRYPYFGKYGILVNADEQGEDDNLTDVMQNMIVDLSLRQRYSRGSGRLAAFHSAPIAKQWEDVL